MPFPLFQLHGAVGVVVDDPGDDVVDPSAEVTGHQPQYDTHYGSRKGGDKAHDQCRPGTVNEPA